MKNLLLLAFLFPSLLWAQESSRKLASDAILLFLRHDQGLTLAEIQKLQEEQGFWKAFPPEGTTV